MKFAHLADIHLGFQKKESLQKIEQEVFERIMDDCISRRVDFILIPGDMFHVNIPEMRVQKYAFAKFRQIHQAGIPVYVVYGSHDFSPISDSVIDLLEKTGYITKVTLSTSHDDGTISLDFVTDTRTGVKLAGLPGLKAGRDIQYYDLLDRESLESEPGFKIFLFHGGISEMKPDEHSEGDYMPLSMLPRGFDYYAGGHLHKYDARTYDNYPHVVYPGTPFAGYHSDLEDNARGTKRGYVLAEFDDTVQNVQLIEMPNIEYELIAIDADAKKPESVQIDLDEEVARIDPAGKEVIITIKGELASGNVTDIDFSKVSEALRDANALDIKINRNKLTSRDYKITAAPGKSKDEIETNVFAENIGEVISDVDALRGDSGVSLAKELIRVLASPQLDAEKVQDYNARIIRDAMKTMELDYDDS